MKKITPLVFLCITSFLASCTSTANNPSFLDAKISDDSSTSSTTSSFYLVSFKNEDTLLDAKKVSKGTRPTFTGTNPTKDEDKTKGIIYSFVGWSENPKANPSQAISSYNLPIATKDTIYYAIFSEIQLTLKKYSVTFKTLTSLLTHNENVLEGSEPKNVYTGPDVPTQDSVTSYDGQTTIYTFVGWSENPSAAPTEAITISNLPVVTKDTIYFAIFSSSTSTPTTSTYSISFVCDGVSLGEPVIVSAGERPKYSGTDPHRDFSTTGGVTKYYTFVGWHPDPNADPKDAYDPKELPLAVKNETYHAIFSYTYDLDFHLQQDTVELEYIGAGRKITAWKGGLTKGENKDEIRPLSSTIPNYMLIYNNLSYDLQSKYMVDWSIPEEDREYFSLYSSDYNYVKVTATKSSRYSTLTASLINRDTKEIEKVATCELRSVSVNVYYLEHQTYTEGKICGCDVSAYQVGYDAIFFPDQYKDGDVVVPSEVTIDGLTKKVTKFGLAFITGNAELGPAQSDLTFRHLFVPNTVCWMRTNTLRYLKSTGSIVFQSGGSNYTMVDEASISVKSISGKQYYEAATKINLTNGTFPYKYYAVDNGSEFSTNPTFSSLTSVNSLIDANYTKKILLKKD